MQENARREVRLGDFLRKMRGTEGEGQVQAIEEGAQKAEEYGD
jgi:hypothetical protein